MSIGAILNSPAGSDYFFSGRFDDVALEVVKKYSLPANRTGEFLELLTAVLNEKIAVLDMPELVAEAFGIDHAQAIEVSLDLAGLALLPLTNFLPSIEAGIKDLGGDLQKYPDLRINNAPQSNSDVRSPRPQTLSEVLSDLELEFDVVHLKRLEFLLKQYAKKDKTKESLKTFFIRPSSIGGLALNEDQAEALLEAALPLAPSLLEETKPVTPLPVSVVQPTALQQPKPELVETQELTVAPSHELLIETQEHEVQNSAPLLAPKPAAVTVPVHDVSPATAAAINAAVKEAAAPPAAPVAAPTKIATPMPIPKPATLPEVKATPTPTTPKPATVPEVIVDKTELKVPAKKAEEAKKIAAPVQDAFAVAVALATEKARDTLKKTKVSEKVFADLADKAIRGVRDIYQTRDIAERDLKIKGSDLALLMQAVTTGVDAYHKSAPMPTSPIPSASGRMPLTRGEGQDEHASDKAKLDDRFAQLTKDKPSQMVPPTKTQLTVGSATLQTPEGQRKVVDVVNSPRLAGPIEQLGSMTPTEFRRLSSNPTEACQKVEDLLATLEGISYEDRVKGVLAWRESPMNQLYLQITEEALVQGLALPEMSSRRRSAGQESLSPAEIKALALLNGNIRF